MGNEKDFLLSALASAVRVLNGEIGVSIRNALGVSGVEADLTSKIDAKLTELFSGDKNESKPESTADDTARGNGRTRRNRNDVSVSGQ